MMMIKRKQSLSKVVVKKKIRRSEEKQESDRLGTSNYEKPFEHG